MKQSTKKLVSFLALGSMLMSTACIFDTRDPQTPSDAGGGCILDTPQKAFVCMAGSLAKLRDGDYERSISANFLFSPTTADSLDTTFLGTPCVYDNWDKTVEMDVLRLLISESDQLTWDYGTPVATINKNTFVRFEVNYSLLVRYKTSPGDTTIYRGIAEIDVKNESGNWRVTYWNETQTVDGSSTWGYLRGIKRQQRGVTCGP
jgi:hypothetical protein